MAITINNVTANNQISIINDAGINPSNSNNGPAKYSGNTEADVVIDGVGYLNINADDIIPANVHALQFSPSSNTGHIEYTSNADNLTIADATELPSWANTMVKRWNGEKAYWTTYETEYAAQVEANANVSTAQTNAQSAATTAKNNILNA